MAKLFSEITVRINSKNRPGYFWAVDEGIEGYLMRESELFRVISPGTLYVLGQYALSD